MNQPNFPSDLSGRGWSADKKLFGWALAVLVILMIGGLAALPLYRHAKVARAQRLAAEVSAWLDAGAVTNSLNEVRLMLNLAPNDAHVLRAAARFCSSNQHPAAVTYWELLLQAVPGSREDHLAFAQAAMDTGRYHIATHELAALIQRPGGDVEAARLALRLALKRGAWDFAVRMADHVLQLAPDDSGVETWRGLALIRTRQPARIAEAQGSLIALLFRAGDHWRDAADALLESPGLSRAQLDLIRRRLTAQAAEGLADRLRVFSVDWLRTPEEQERVSSEVIELAAQAKSGAELQLAGRWLLLHGQAAAVLGRFTLESSRGDRGKMQLHLLALARLERWDEIAAVAGQPDTGLEAHLGTMFSVLAASRKPVAGPQEAARAVLADRELELPQLIEAAQLAEENGLDEAAIYLLEYLLDQVATLPEAANRILVLGSRTDSVLHRRRALERLVKAFPTDQAALQQLAYVEAVLPGGNLTVVDRLERQPGSSTNQFVQLVGALADVRRGKPDAALARLMAAPPPGDVQDYRLNLAYAAAYGAAGNSGEARRHAAAAAAQARLQIEERALIEPWLPIKPADHTRP